ncbi:zinc ribbon domain-containing protein [Clostridium sp. LCP25S3_F10]|uniref:zinc ribbon domain-containing protein n=1 Tax=Clostridium sp. LCP25S3_F10 TaxID=3438750 RepID=UPI003F933C8F
MHFCRKCGNKLQENLKHCNICGSEIEKIHKEETSNINALDDKKINDEHILIHKEEPLEKIKKFNFIKKMKENKFPFILILTLIVIGVFFIKNPVKNFFIRNNSSNWLVYAFDKYKEYETLDTVSDFNVKFTVQPQKSMEYENIEDIIEQCTLKVNNKIDKNTNEVYSKINLIYKKENILSGEVYSNKEYMAIETPQLYKDIIYIKWQDLNKLIDNNDSMDAIDPKNYANALSIKKSKYYNEVNKNYKEFFNKSLNPYVKKGDTVQLTIGDKDKEKSIKCNEIVVHLNNEGIMKILNALFQKVSEDESLKLLVQDRIFEFLDTAQNKGELNKINISKDEIDSVKKNFNLEYDAFVKELNNIEKEDKKSLNAKINSLTKVRIDSQNHIRGVKSQISVEKQKTCFNFISNTAINSINSKLDMKKIAIKGGKDISNFNQEDIKNMIKEIENNVQKNMILKLNIK